jgi:hypothetical protein
MGHPRTLREAAGEQRIVVVKGVGVSARCRRRGLAKLRMQGQSVRQLSPREGIEPGLRQGLLAVEASGEAQAADPQPAGLAAAGLRLPRPPEAPLGLAWQQVVAKRGVKARGFRARDAARGR